MTTKITINKIETEKLIKAYFRKSTMKTTYANQAKKEIRLMLKYIEHDLKRSYALNLNEEVISKFNGMAPGRVKKMRTLMKEMGLIYFDEKTLQRKLGDYPKWMIDFRFTEIEYIDEVTKEKRKVNFFSSKYNKEFHRITRKVINDLLSYECPPRGIDFVVAVYNNRAEMLERIGKVKEDFLV